MANSSSQSVMFDVIENLESMVRIMDEDNNIIYMNQRMRDMFGHAVGQKCYDILGGCKCEECVSMGCRATSMQAKKDVVIGDRIYKIIASPVSSSRMAHYSVEIFEDITEQKRIEEENSRHYEELKEDIDFAKQVQRSALPEDGTYWNAVRLCSFYEPCETLSGDIFDIVKVDENRILFYIADVSGHGIRSSLFTIFLRQTIRGIGEKAGDLECFLNELIHSYENLNSDGEQYFSILAGLYDREANTVTFINAGHNCPPVVITDEKITEIAVSGMPVCSLIKKANHPQKEIRVKKGDIILLYTDGISETYNRDIQQDFGEERLMEVVKEYKRNPQFNLVDTLVKSVEEFSKQDVVDDKAIAAVEIL